jgi:choloylglycine hydrolase
MKAIRTMMACASVGYLMQVTTAEACTTVGMHYGQGAQEQRLVGKSYDWDIEEAYIVTNKKGVRKEALIFTDDAEPLSWTSRYNSISFNQYGRELPNSGMNETGLVIEVMVLDSSSYPRADERPLINESQMVQHVLDTAGSVPEALELFRAARMAPVMVQLHYLICDLRECAVVEYRSSREVIYQVRSLPYSALANHDYDQSSAHLRQYDGFGGTRPLPAASSESLRRFAIAASSAHRFAQQGSSDGVTDTFSVLKRVETSGTQWVIVYDQKERTISYKTRSAPQIRTIKAGTGSALLSGTCGDSPVLMLPLHENARGDRTSAFKPYNKAENTRIVRRHLGGRVPAPVVDAAVGYPDATVCE